ncbi:MAG: MFS transporter [Sphingobium sp.]
MNDRQPVDGRGSDPRWRQVAACLVLQSVSAGTITSAFSVLAVPFAMEFGATRMVVMLAMTATLLVTAISSPFAGRLLDLVSIRRLMLLGSLALGAGFMAASVATTFVQILIIYAVLLAPANVLIGPLAASVLLSRWFDQDRGRALGIAALGISLGGFGFPPFIQYLIETVGWRPALQILASLVFLLSMGACWMVVDRRATPLGAIAGATPQDMPMAMGAIFANREFWLMSLVFGVLLTGMMGLVTNLVPLAMDRGIPLSMATLLISALSLGSVAGKVAFATFADRLASKAILFFGAGGFLLGMSCFLVPQWGFGVMVAGAAIVGFTNGSAVPLQTIVAARTFGLHNVGRVVGLLNLTVMLVGLFVPPAFGLIRDLTGEYDGAFITYLAFASIALVVITMMRGAGGIVTLSSPVAR